MILSRLAPLFLIPLVAAEGVHRLKLKKIPPATSDPALESLYLSQKYGGQYQTPMMGAGGVGRNVRLGRPTHQDGEELFWTQDGLKTEGGHNVPLSSKITALSDSNIGAYTNRRLHECAVLRRNSIRDSSSDRKLTLTHLSTRFLYFFSSKWSSTLGRSYLSHLLTIF